MEKHRELQSLWSLGLVQYQPCTLYPTATLKKRNELLSQWRFGLVKHHPCTLCYDDLALFGHYKDRNGNEYRAFLAHSYNGALGVVSAIKRQILQKIN